MRLIPFFLAAFLATACHAAPPEIVPVPPPEANKWNELHAIPGRLLVLSAQTASKWILVDEEGGDLRDFDGGKSCAFVAPAAGRFRIIVISPDGTSSRVVVVVGDVPAPPNPKPPAPPVDPLKAKLKVAYDADSMPVAAKVESARDLAALYRQAAQLVVKPDVATAGELLARVKTAASSLVGADALKGVRTVVAGELSMLFPADGPLTEQQRQKAAELFTKLAGILDGLGV
jgi:hypothetical protein